MSCGVINLKAGSGTYARNPCNTVAGEHQQLPLTLEEREVAVCEEVADEARALHAKGLEAVTLAGCAQVQS